MKTAIIFSGQGAQSVGMGKDLYENNKVYKSTFDELDEKIELSLKKACFEGCETSEHVQPAIYAHSISLFKAVAIKADIYAGLSLGEYTALVAAGVIDMADCTTLVNKRGSIMDGAVEKGTCGMVSCIGLTIDVCEKIAHTISSLYVANHISKTQIVFAGTNDAINKAVIVIELNGAKAIKLNTAGPFHSPMLEVAANEFKTLFNTVEIKQQQAIIYSNYTGLPYENNADYSEMLAKQMCSRVKWYDVCEQIIQSGVQRIIEIGPGMVLSKVLKRRVKEMDIEIISIRDLNTFDKFNKSN